MPDFEVGLSQGQKAVMRRVRREILQLMKREGLDTEQCVITLTNMVGFFLAQHRGLAGRAPETNLTTWVVTTLPMYTEAYAVKELKVE